MSIIPESKRIVVLGHQRSGTRYMAYLLQAYGYDVGHEEMKIDGISDWHLVPDYQKHENDFMIHVVRYPLDVIASTLFTSHMNSINFMQRKLDFENRKLFEAIVMLYMKWNEIIEEKEPDFTIKVEDASKCDWGNLIGVLPPTDCNGRPHAKLDWDDIESTDRELADQLRNVCRKYGYSAV